MNMWRRLLLATVCGVAVSTLYASQPILAPMGQGLGLPVGLSGWIVSVAQLGYLVGLVLLVPLGDVVLDRRRLIGVHLTLTAVAMIVTASASTGPVAFAGLAAAGMFAVVVQTTVAYAASISPPAERGRTIGIVTSGVMIGILGARVVTGMLADAWGWRAVYVALAVLLLGLAALVVAVLPQEEYLRLTGYRQAVACLGGLFGRRSFLTRGLIAFFLFASFGTLWSGLSSALSATPWHLSETRVGLFGLAGLSGALGAIRAGRWADAGRARVVSGLALVLLIGSWVAIAQLSWSLWILVIGIVALDFAVQAVHVSNQHVLTTSFPERLSSVIGSYMVFYSLGSAAGAATTTAVFTAYGWLGSSLLGAGFAICALAVWASGERIPLGGANFRPGTADIPRPEDRCASSG